MTTEHNAFVSGSHVYGTPNEKSDIDIVVFMDENLAKWLYGMLHDGSDNSHTPAFGSIAIRHGKINLICCWHEWVYDIWVKGTGMLHAAKPVTRDEAITLFNNLRYGPSVMREREEQAKIKGYQNGYPIDDIPFLTKHHENTTSNDR